MSCLEEGFSVLPKEVNLLSQSLVLEGFALGRPVQESKAETTKLKESIAGKLSRKWPQNANA